VQILELHKLRFCLTSTIDAMANWEFLLQKKGDKSWLPLESPTIEILAGEYRLAARSGWKDRVVDITWHYAPATDEYEPLENSLPQQISSEGLVLIMPFTNLTPGTWQISCTVGTELKANLEIVIPAPPTEPQPAQITLNTTHFLLDQETRLEITGTADQPGALEVVVMQPQNRAPLFQQTFTVPSGKFTLPIELPQLVDCLVLLGEIRWQNQTIATLTFTFPVERLRPQTPPPPKPEAKPDIKLPPVKPTPMQPLAPPKEQTTNGKVTVVETDDLFEELEDIFDPIDQLLSQPAPAPVPKVVVFVPPPVPRRQRQEYTPGKPLLLRGTIPKQPGKWAIKLWVKDCQTRRIVDGPRWLLDWQTQGEVLQTETYLTFPLGYLTVTIEAITVDLTTDAQSRKFHLDCPLHLELPST
jgi:hypothetical protein